MQGTISHNWDTASFQFSVDAKVTLEGDALKELPFDAAPIQDGLGLVVRVGLQVYDVPDPDLENLVGAKAARMRCREETAFLQSNTGSIPCQVDYGAFLSMQCAT